MVLPVVTTLDEARHAIRDLAEENEKLSNELAWFKRQMFGSKTEHYIPEDDTPSLFPEEEEEAPIEKAPQKVSEHERRVRQPNALSEIPSDLPREEHIIDVPEEKRQGMTFIGYEESERIAYRTGLYVIHFKRAKYADPSDALRGVVTAPAPGDVFDSVSGRTRYDVSFIAKVVADKVENAIPLERQARMFGSARLHHSRRFRRSARHLEAPRFSTRLNRRPAVAEQPVPISSSENRRGIFRNSSGTFQ